MNESASKRYKFIHLTRILGQMNGGLVGWDDCFLRRCYLCSSHGRCPLPDHMTHHERGIDRDIPLDDGERHRTEFEVTCERADPPDLPIAPKDGISMGESHLI